MSFFTLAYLARLEVWGVLVTLLQGGLVVASWHMWARAAQHAAAIVRYRMACLHFAALALLPMLTVAILQWTVAGAGIAPPHGSPVAELPVLMAGYRAALRLALPLAVLWLVGSLAMTLWLARDARRLARLPCEPAPMALVETVQQLARDAIIPDVQVADIATPQVIGAWRPVLRLPRDLELRLPAAERDAALRHELAHVWRRDFGWNLLQRFMLALLWFQPAAWMLYRQLSREREVCCDALAVRHGASATSLARALVHLAENRTGPALGMGIATQGELAARVHHLLGLTRPKASSTRVRLGAVAASALCLIALGAGRLGHLDPSLADLYHASDFGPTVSIDAHDAAGAFALRIRRGRVIGATVGQQPLPRERIRQQGDHVTLLDATEQPILALTVTPQDRIEWTARHEERGQ